jgi:dinuclear metal center YbgI/SA1388 family protein
LSQCNLSLDMLIREIINALEQFASLSYQESYDNAGLLTGNPDWTCTGSIVALDATEEVVQEALSKGCNLVIAHHPIVFSGLKKITGKNYVEKAVITAIKNDIALYAIHTNLDNVKNGVNGKIAEILGLTNLSILRPGMGMLKKLYSFVPVDHLDKVRNALFTAGAGEIGNYNECSFQTPGTGTYKPGEGTNPFAGKPGQRHEEKEARLEVIFPAPLEPIVLKALVESHPYEEVAYDIIQLTNPFSQVGSGLIGELPSGMEELEMLKRLKELFKIPVIRHSPLLNKSVKKVAVCGGAGSFLISSALQLKADMYITGDVKYHEFFDANGALLLADIGHFESEQYTIDLLYDILAKKFPTFAVFKTGVLTNPVNYYS